MIRVTFHGNWSNNWSRINCELWFCNILGSEEKYTWDKRHPTESDFSCRFNISKTPKKQTLFLHFMDHLKCVKIPQALLYCTNIYAIYEHVGCIHCFTKHIIMAYTVNKASMFHSQNPFPTAFFQRRTTTRKDTRLLHCEPV